jgi:hypothetical protein
MPFYWLDSLDMVWLQVLNLKKKLTDIGFGFGFSWIGKRLFSMDLDF